RVVDRELEAGLSEPAHPRHRRALRELLCGEPERPQVRVRRAALPEAADDVPADEQEREREDEEDARSLVHQWISGARSRTSVSSSWRSFHFFRSGSMYGRRCSVTVEFMSGMPRSSPMISTFRASA